MHFVSLPYLVLLVVVLTAYYILQVGGRFQRQNVVLLLASYVFYAWFSWGYAAALLVATLVNHRAGIRIQDAAEPDGDAAERKRWLRISLIFNLGLLAYFKYAGFFVDSARGALGTLGLELSWTVEHVWLPLGISFFTFQNIGYTLDVYYGRVEPVRQLRDFALFVAFFPQLIMGPIERAKDLVPQIQSLRAPTLAVFQQGVWLIFLGFTKKLVIADPIGEMVAPLFPEHASGASYLSGHVLAGAFLFMLQIYVDFVSYTDVARGSAKLFGFELSKNFQTPYLAENLREFWARWHISLSSWINDYLFTWMALQPRLSRILKTSGILVVTMSIMGFWHGASLGFLAWGAYHGVLLVLYHRMRPALHRRTQFQTAMGHRVFLALSIATTFGVVTLGEVLFRAESLDQSLAMYRDLLTNHGMSAPAFANVLAGIRLYAFVLVLDILEYRRGDEGAIVSWPWPWRRLVQFGMCGFLLQALADQSLATGADFHYFRF